MTKDAIAKVPRTRPQRAKIGTKDRLVVHNKDSNYEYRFVNDVKNRVAIFKQNGWEVAPAADTQIGDVRVENPTSIGSAAAVPVGLVGENAGTAVLMRIPKEWYEEDQAAKAKAIEASEQSMKEAIRSGHKGQFEITR